MKRLLDRLSGDAGEAIAVTMFGLLLFIAAISQDLNDPMQLGRAQVLTFLVLAGAVYAAFRIAAIEIASTNSDAQRCDPIETPVATDEWVGPAEE